MKQKLNIYLLYAFFLASLLIPTFFVNKLLFIAILGMYVVGNRKIQLKIFAPIMIIALFFVGFIHGLLNKCDEGLATQFLLSSALLLLIYPIIHENIDVRAMIKRMTPIYVIVSLLLIVYGINQIPFELPGFIISFASMLDIAPVNAIGKILEEYGAIAIGYRSFFGGSGIMIHLGSVPFLLLSVGIYAQDLFENKKDRTKTIIILIGALLVSVVSTSRALVLGELLLICFVFLKCQKTLNKVVFFFMFSFIALLAVGYLISESTIFSLSDSSNNVKLGHVRGFFEQLNPKNFILGDGLASYYYSPGVNGNLAHTEVTLLDFIRYFGIFGGIYVYIVLLFPQTKINVRYYKNSFAFVIFLMYLVVSLTNPVLFNSYGVISILFYWSDYTKQINNTSIAKGQSLFLCVR